MCEFKNIEIGQKWPQYKGLSPTPLAIKKKNIETLNVQ
jgi:hypothetical protein